jgi:hypothetical protein
LLAGKVVGIVALCDNGAEATADGTVPDPLLVLDMENGQVITPAPDNLKALQCTPEWAKAILEAALREDHSYAK